jgi:hypothetical protein
LLALPQPCAPKLSRPSAGSAYQGGKLFIEFGAAMQLADVWVNGVHKIQHQGGYAPFTIDLTADLAHGGADTSSWSSSTVTPAPPGLAAVDETNPDVVILDMTMPDLDGAEGDRSCAIAVTVGRVRLRSARRRHFSESSEPKFPAQDAGVSEASSGNKYTDHESGNVDSDRELPDAAQRFGARALFGGGLLYSHLFSME